MKLNTKLSLLFFLVTFLLSPMFLAQDADDIIDDIEGKVNKITITTEDDEYTFEGEEAEKLFKRMKSYSGSFVWRSSEGNAQKNVVIMESDAGEHFVKVYSNDDDVTILSDDFDTGTDGVRKKIRVEVEDGNKKVTVTTNENGEEKTEVYEGDEADKYLGQMKEKHEGEIDICIEKDEDGKIKKKKIIIEKETEKGADVE